MYVLLSINIAHVKYTIESLNKNEKNKLKILSL
jgi:hypothetical protein